MYNNDDMLVFSVIEMGVWKINFQKTEKKKAEKILNRWIFSAKAKSTLFILFSFSN